MGIGYEATDPCAMDTASADSPLKAAVNRVAQMESRVHDGAMELRLRLKPVTTPHIPEPAPADGLPPLPQPMRSLATQGIHEIAERMENTAAEIDDLLRRLEV